jgi:uncharacterized protein (TIGR00369 family)
VAPDDKFSLAATRSFVEGIPHNRALGMKVLSISRAEAIFALPYAAKLVGNPDTGVLHGGAITALLDAASGAAVFAALTDWVPIATLDLRIDYLRAAEPGHDVVARATCYKLGKNVAFTRAIAYHQDAAAPHAEPDLIASSVGTFMLGTKPGGPKEKKP